MTNKQAYTVEHLRRAIEDLDLHSEEYEFKVFEVNERDTHVELYCVSGLKNDEDTMAELLCRKTRQIFIHRGGGLSCFDNRKPKGRGAALHNWTDVLIYGYRN